MTLSAAEEGLVEFLHVAQPRLSRLALLLSGDPDTAEDLVQDTMVKVVRKWEHVRRSRDGVAYACGVMINQWRDTGRRLGRSRDADLASTRGEQASVVLDGKVLDRITLGDAIKQLTAKQRAVLYFRYYEDLSVQQVAEILGCSPGTVKSQTAYALRRLSTSGALAPDTRRP